MYVYMCPFITRCVITDLIFRGRMNSRGFPLVLMRP